MAKAKNSKQQKKINATKTKLVYNINGKKIPVYQVPQQTILDAEEFILYAAAKPVKGKSLVIRKQDLMAKSLLQNPRLAFLNAFGRNIIETFSPTYGAYVNPGFIGLFYFLLSRVLQTTNSGWFMSLPTPEGSFYTDQVLSFAADCTQVSNPHLRVHLGPTTDATEVNPVLTITTDEHSYKIFLAPLNHKSFSIMLPQNSGAVTLSLKKDDNPRGFCTIISIDLYESLFFDPGPLDTLEI